MSEEGTSPSCSIWSRIHWVKWLTIVAVLLLLVGLLFPTIGCKDDPMRTTARTYAAHLVVALKQYHTEYGAVPGGGNAQILTALRGDNPRKVVFLEIGPNKVSARGELLDPWKMPYRIDASDAAFPKVYSFGKDKQDNGGEAGSDDITSWR